MAAILDFCRFLPIKWPKSKIFKIHQSDLWNVTQGRYMQNFRFLACMVSKWMYLLCFWDIAIWSSCAYSNYLRTQIFKKSYLGLRIIFFDAVFCLLLYSMRSLKITKHDFWPLDPPPCGLNLKITTFNIKPTPKIFLALYTTPTNSKSSYKNPGRLLKMWYTVTQCPTYGPIIAAIAGLL